MKHKTTETMKTIQLNLYTINELTGAAKEKAREWWRNGNTDYSWADEALASLKALAAHFDGKLADWSIDWGNSTPSSARFDMPDDMEPAEIETRLGKLGSFNPETGKGLGDCVLTGYSMDEDAIDGFRADWRKGERDLHKLMLAAFTSWLEATQADYKDQQSDEQVDEACESNGYEFTADGKRFVAPKS